MKSKFKVPEILVGIIIPGIVLMLGTITVFRMVKDGRIRAFEKNAIEIIEQAENEYTTNNFYGDYFFIKNKEYSANTRKLEYSGRIPVTGKIIVNELGRVSLILHDGSYCATKASDQEEIKIKKIKIEKCQTYQILRSTKKLKEIAFNYDVEIKDLLELNKQIDSELSATGINLKIPIKISDLNNGFETLYEIGKIEYKENYTGDYTFKTELSNIKEEKEVSSKKIFEDDNDLKKYIIQKKIKGENLSFEEIKKSLLTNKDFQIKESIIVCKEKCFLETTVNIINLEKNNLKELYLPIKFKLENKKEEVEINLYKDNTNANIPEISENLIPIMWENNTWVKADPKEKWYDYELGEWANAAVIEEKSRNYYKTVEAGTKIHEDHVLAYFVWIPKFSYKPITTKTEVEISFKNESASEWISHPAFKFGETDINGIWVGKFETSTMSEACYQNNTKETCNTENILPTIKPNKIPLTNQNLNNKYKTARNFLSVIYGLKKTNDPHIMKNTEWGAVAYLTHSKYGRIDEVMINNSNITGCAAEWVNQAKVETCNEYKSEKGLLASTTKNVYGIYDMNGLKSEIVMGIVKSKDEGPLTGSTLVLNSGFSGFNEDGSFFEGTPFPDSKYYDSYERSTQTNNHNRAILGDATNETRNIYTDYSAFANNLNPFFERGGSNIDGAKAGIFSYKEHKVGSEATYNTSFRTVLIIK